MRSGLLSQSPLSCARPHLGLARPTLRCEDRDFSRPVLRCEDCGFSLSITKELSCGTHEDGCVRHRCPVCRKYRLKVVS